MTWRAATAAEARAAIARAWLEARGGDTLGRIVLRPHQRSAAARLRHMLAEHGGALLADPVGLGKTFTALAAVRDMGRVLVIAPAALRPMWTDALASAATTADFVSYQALSRGRVRLPAHDIVIADEAHHMRNPGTRRYRAVARHCDGASVLLLSATPIHNRADDLRAQLALFLGRRAWVTPEHELARYVVRREDPDLGSTPGPRDLPRVDRVRWLDTSDDSRILQAVMQLPPPVAAADGGDGGILVALSLVRQWASSRAALESALRTRLAQADALFEAFATERYPTRAQLRAWCYADGALQLAFPQIATDNPIPDHQTLIDDASHHIRAVRGLLDDLNREPDPDDARANALRAVLDAHPESRVVVFAEFAATVRALFARMVRYGGIAMLSGRGGMVSGGRLTRRDVLAQFSPHQRQNVHPSRRIRMLITTDLFSEGVNLQEANVVVHADLPWSPARCEQRVGRVRRLGSRYSEVFAYALRPPASADLLLRLEERLRHKISIAARAIGVGGTIMPRLFAEPTVEAPRSLLADAELSALLERWWRALPEGSPRSPMVAAARADIRGFIAVVDWGDGPTIVARINRDIRSGGDEVLPAARCADGDDVPLDPTIAEEELRRLIQWCEHREALAFIELPDGNPDVARRRLLRRIETITRRTPRHLRSRYVPMAREARRAAALAYGAGAEEVLAELAEANMPDGAWLKAVRTFAQLHARYVRGAPPTVKALLLLVPTSSPPAADPP